MDRLLYKLSVNQLNALNNDQKKTALASIESGKVVFLPEYVYCFPAMLNELLFSENLLDGKHKNISFDYQTQRLGGYNKDFGTEGAKNFITIFMHDFAKFSKTLVETLFPQYQDALLWGRTSYRPAEIEGRKSSKRKDDTRLHVDSFAASPVNGLRILRVFCNINPEGKPRVWHLGEPFGKVMERFSSKLPTYNRTIAKLLHKIKVTKSLRSAYDHYQLHLHDAMKLSEHYQNTVEKNRIDFPAQSTWLVFTDQVSHAALSGQFLLEQTFYLPINAMENADLSPFKHWKRERKIE